MLYAGGVTDGRGLVAALALGCDAVAMGTRFWACEESLGNARLRQRLVEGGGDDTSTFHMVAMAKYRFASSAFTDVAHVVALWSLRFVS